MCFSAAASLVTAAMVGAIGVVSVRSARTPAELPLAGIPLLFAAQQAAEGGLWLALEHGDAGPWPWLFTQVFLAFALVIWPVYAPVAAWLVEPDRRRRQIMQASFLVGVAVASFFLVQLMTLRNEGYISGSHILYRTDVESPVLAGLIYMCAAVLALVVSSHRAIAVLGAIICVGALVTYAFMQEVFVSVWCFFAAASSFVILAHFQQSRIRSAWG
jgi:hypothetical protein